MNKPFLPLVTLLVALPLTLACGGTARIVTSDPEGGRIRVDGPYSDRAITARELMAQHCNGPFAVFEDAPPDKWPALIDSPNEDQTEVVFLCKQ